MKKINNIFNTANKSLFAIGDTSRRSTPDSSGQRRILLSSCRGPISPLARGVPARAGCRKFGVWFATLVALFVATPSFAEPTELDKKTVASKAYVDTKQDKITTGNVMLWDEPEGTEGDIYVPGLVVYDPQTSALSGNKIGILDHETIMEDEGGLVVYSHVGGYGTEMDNFVPTVRAVAEALHSAMPNALGWDTNTINAINAYSTTFGNGENNWAGDSSDMITGHFLANSLALKQNILPAAWTSTTNLNSMASTGGLTIELGVANGSVERRYITAGGSQPLTQKTGADNVILYINGTKTLAQYQTSNFGGTGGAGAANMSQNYIKGALVSLELLKDVYSALHNEIQNATPTGTPGNVAMYDATTGALGDGRPAADAASYNETTGALENGGNIATIAAVDTRQKKKECGGYEPGHENEADYCWLWVLPD